jgi:hypothetical protein
MADNRSLPDATPGIRDLRHRKIQELPVAVNKPPAAIRALDRAKLT